MSALNKLRSFAESREADALIMRDALCYGDVREIVAEIEALQKDAERYRWLRSHINYRDRMPPTAIDGTVTLAYPLRVWAHESPYMSAKTIDEAIDAALAKDEP